MKDVFSSAGDGRSWSDRLRLVHCARAGDFVPALGPRCFAHAGPPADPEDLAPGLVGGLTAGLALEGERVSPEQVRRMVRAGELSLVPGHEVAAVGPLAGVVTPGTPVWVVEADRGGLAVSPVHEGPDAAMRSGQFHDEVITRLRWYADVFAPAVDAALGSLGGIDPVSVLASGVNRGDEAHNRNVANSAELLRRLAPAVVRGQRDSARGAEVLAELADNVQGFLPVGMAAAKLMVDRVHRDGPPGLVTAAGANGRDFGIRVSGLDGWVTSPSSVQEIASTWAGRSRSDAAPLIGDSLVMELIGLGVSALTAAPKLAQALGAEGRAAEELVRAATAISLARSELFSNPNDGFRGTPVGLRVIAISETGIAPTFTVGYLSREVGAGRVGAGFYRPDPGLFHRAAAQLGASALAGRVPQ